MGKSSFSGPVYSGGVPLLPNRFGWKKAATSWFVDGNYGSDGNSGKEADQAFLTIGYAISRASEFDVIYVLDKGHDAATDPDPYTEATTNLSVAFAKSNLSIVGVPNNIHQTYQIQIKPVSASTSPALTILAPFVAVENLCFNKRGDGVGSCVYLYDEGDSTSQAQGSSIYNCHLRNADLGSAAHTTNGGIKINGGWYYTIKDCYFIDCRNGIVMGTSGASTLKGIQILNCNFAASAVANVDVDILLVPGSVGSVGHIIDRCVFSHEVPAFAGAGTLTAYIYDTISTQNLVSNCFFGTDDATCKDTVTHEIVLKQIGSIAGSFDGASQVVWA